MSDALNETVIRIVDDPDREGGVIIRNNLPDCDRVDPAALTPAQKAGAMIMRNVKQMIEVGTVGATQHRAETQPSRQQLMNQLTKAANRTQRKKRSRRKR